MQQCDNKCSHGCNHEQKLYRIEENYKVMTLNLCKKALAEYKDCKITMLNIVVCKTKKAA